MQVKGVKWHSPQKSYVPFTVRDSQMLLLNHSTFQGTQNMLPYLTAYIRDFGSDC